MFYIRLMPGAVRDDTDPYHPFSLHILLDVCVGPGTQGPWEYFSPTNWSEWLYKKRVSMVSTLPLPSVDSGGVLSAGNAPAGSRGGDGGALVVNPLAC